MNREEAAREICCLKPVIRARQAVLVPSWREADSGGLAFDCDAKPIDRRAKWVAQQNCCVQDDHRKNEKFSPPMMKVDPTLYMVLDRPCL